MKEYPKFSVLMSVYVKESPDYLEQAFKSILWQTVLPNEIVVVKDGLLTNELNVCIKEFQRALEQLNVPLIIIQNKVNKGLGYSLNIGVSNCHYEYIARMDTDDIAFANKFEKQLEYISSHKDVSILGTNSIEFSKETTALRSNYLPAEYTAIIQRLSTRNPFIHPTVFLNRLDVLNVGNYQICPYFEDYYLWIRMLNAGLFGYNLHDELLMSRVDDNLYLRRGGWKYVKAIKIFRSKIKHYKIINSYFNFLTSFAQSVIALQPNKIRKYIYTHILRRSESIPRLPNYISDEIN